MDYSYLVSKVASIGSSVGEADQWRDILVSRPFEETPSPSRPKSKYSVRFALTSSSPRTLTKKRSLHSQTSRVYQKGADQLGVAESRGSSVSNPRGRDGRLPRGFLVPSPSLILSRQRREDTYDSRDSVNEVLFHRSTSSLIESHFSFDPLTLFLNSS